MNKPDWEVTYQGIPITEYNMRLAAQTIDALTQECNELRGMIEQLQGRSNNGTDATPVKGETK